jgi:hypothetical protein
MDKLQSELSTPGARVQEELQAELSTSSAQMQNEPTPDANQAQQELRVELQASGYITPAGRFEVLAITAGEGNGWQFSADVLQESVPLWDGVECFVDHASWFSGRSLRDLGRMFRNPLVG